MLVDIKHRLHGESIFQAEAPSLKQALTDLIPNCIAAFDQSSHDEYVNYRYVSLHLSVADLPEVDLRGADLRYIDLSLADLRGADLRDTQLYQAEFYGADLRGADLRGTNLNCAHLSRHDFPYEQAFLSGARLEECKPGSNWHSRLLLSEILRQAAGEDPDKQQAADQIPIRGGTVGDYDVVDWDKWAWTLHPFKDWMLDTLARYVEENGEYTPNLLKNRFPGDGRRAA